MKPWLAVLFAVGVALAALCALPCHGSVTFRVLFARNVPQFDLLSDTDLLVRVSFDDEVKDASVLESRNPVWPPEQGTLVFPDATDSVSTTRSTHFFVHP